VRIISLEYYQIDKELTTVNKVQLRTSDLILWLIKVWKINVTDIIESRQKGTHRTSFCQKVKISPEVKEV